MKKCVCCGRETYHKVGEQTVCARCDVDGSFEYHLKKQAAQQSVQSDGLTICQNCGSWLRAGECENCNSPIAPARR